MHRIAVLHMLTNLCAQMFCPTCVHCIPTCAGHVPFYLWEPCLIYYVHCMPACAGHVPFYLWEPCLIYVHHMPTCAGHTCSILFMRAMSDLLCASHAHMCWTCSILPMRAMSDLCATHVHMCWTCSILPMRAIPTNIASVNLVVGCPNARAGVWIVEKKTLRATKFRPLC